MFADDFKILKANALDADFGRAEVEDKAQGQTSRAQIVKGLRDVFFVDCVGTLDFKQKRIFDQNVGSKIAHDEVMV